MGPQLKVSSDGLEKLGIEPVTRGLQGKGFIHYTTAASEVCLKILNRGIIKTLVSQSYVPPVNGRGDILCSCGLQHDTRVHTGLNVQDCLEKPLKLKFALYST